MQASTVPLQERYLDDYRVGEVFEFGDRLVTEAEIIDFARRYDPQPFHVDPVAARESSFGTLVASGWMTGAIAMALTVEHFISPRAAMGSPGVDQLRWPHPVRPGDRLRLRVTVLEVRRSRSKPDRGVLRLRQELLTLDGTVVLSQEAVALQRCRPGSPTP